MKDKAKTKMASSEPWQKQAPVCQSVSTRGFQSKLGKSNLLLGNKSSTGHWENLPHPSQQYHGINCAPLEKTPSFNAASVHQHVLVTLNTSHHFQIAHPIHSEELA